MLGVPGAARTRVAWGGGGGHGAGGGGELPRRRAQSSTKITEFTRVLGADSVMAGAVGMLTARLEEVLTRDKAKTLSEASSSSHDCSERF